MGIASKKSIDDKEDENDFTFRQSVWSKWRIAINKQNLDRKKAHNA